MRIREAIRYALPRHPIRVWRERLGDLWWYAALLFVAQIIFYGIAQYGHMMAKRGMETNRTVVMVTYLCVVNVASAQAFWQFLRGKKQVTWQPRT